MKEDDAMRQDSATSDFVEVDFVENEMGNFAGSFLSSPSRHHEDDVHIRPSTVGALWLFSFNIALPLFMMTATTISGIGANSTSSSILLPWFADGHNLGLMHAIVFVITLLIWTLVTHVHRRNRAHGFLTFYRNTRRIKDAPLLAIGLAVLLILAWLIALNGKTEWMDHHAWTLFAGLNLLELCVACWAVLKYSCRVRLQNHSGKTDVETQLRDHDSPLLPPSTTTNRQEQADLISLLRSKEKNLSQELLFLRSKLSDYENSGQINEVLEARQRQICILTQKEEDLVDLVRALEKELDESQQTCEELAKLADTQRSNMCRLQILLDAEQETTKHQNKLLSAIDSTSVGRGS